MKGQLFELRNDEEFIAAVISRLPGVADGKISDCLFNIEELLTYGSPAELTRIVQLVFARITFDWENEKLNFTYIQQS